MLLRLYAFPLMLAVAAVLALWVLGLVLPDLFADSPYLAALGLQVQGLALPACWVLVAAATVAAGWQTVRLWLWTQGKTDSCHNCGGMVQDRDGRRGRGPYVHCLACGTNRPLR
jgi:hypothetical protein